jgi:acylpyruvate hydrolase
MRLVTVDTVGGGAPAAVLRSGDVALLQRVAEQGSAEAWIPCSVRAILESGDEGLAIVRRLVARVEHKGEDERQHLRARGDLCAPGVRLLAPLPQPCLIVAAGLAYKSHLAEMAGTPTPPHPTAFTKSPNAIVGPDSDVLLPRGATECVDYEGELAVVFGRACHDATPAAAMRCVAGYTVANDISARDWVREVWAAKAPWEARLTWEVNIMGKQFDGFLPLGPALLTADEAPDVSALHLTTRLNGTVMQSAPVSDLIFELGDTIAYLSRWYTFRPGDVLLTGTPAGVGVGRKPPVFMRAGDVVEVEVEGIGVLRNFIRAAPSVGGDR